MENVAKKPWKSKTLFLNGVMGLISFIMLFWEGASAAQTFIQANAVEIGMFWSLLNVVLRVVTKEKISLTE